jgi:flagellin
MPNIISSVTNIGAMSANRYLAINTDNVTRATEALASGSRVSNPAYDPASASVGYSFAARIGMLTQAAFNVTQATAQLQMVTSVLGSTQNILTQMQQLTAQANTGTLGSAELAMLNQTYQQLLGQINNNANINSRWGQVSLLSGGGGVLNTLAAAQNNLIVNAAAAASIPANTVSAYQNTVSTGLVAGAVSSVSVSDLGYVDIGASATPATPTYLVSVQIGNQTFQGATNPVASSNFTLTSTSDIANSIVMMYTAAVTGITGAASFQSALATYFGLVSGSPAVFQSSSALGMTTLVPNANITVGSGVSPGTYSLSYMYDPGTLQGTFRLSNGQQTWSQQIGSTTTNIPVGTAQSVSFPNGFAFTTAAGGGVTSYSQSLYTITPVAGSSQTYNYQIGDKPTDVVTATFPGSTTTALNLNGTNVLSATTAATASASLGSALSIVGSQIASLGGVYTQLQVIGTNLQTSIQNQTAAKSTFTDTDVAQTMVQLQNSKGLQQIASSVFTNALRQSQELAQMVGQLN